jgi:uncharacterized SAM-binding protein YcdF (DUF218 family)
MRAPPTLREYLDHREVEREPEVPDLSSSEVEAVGRAAFVENGPRPSDLLFVFGSAQGDWELVARLYASGLAPVVLVTGRAGEDYYATGIPQAHSIRAALLALGVPATVLLVEDTSDNTYENVHHAKALLERENRLPRSILFVCKSHHSGRAWRTLSLAFPEATLSCASYDGVYKGVSVSQATWSLHEVSRRRVYGEFQRMQLYAARGQIANHGPNAVA